MSEVYWEILIILSRSGTIVKDEVEESTSTIITVVFKASECMKSTVFLQHIFDHCRTWKLKHWSIIARACRF